MTAKPLGSRSVSGAPLEPMTVEKRIRKRVDTFGSHKNAALVYSAMLR